MRMALRSNRRRTSGGNIPRPRITPSATGSRVRLRCFRCPVACGKDFHVHDGEYAGTQWKMPEYETIFALGSMLDNPHKGSIVKANELCDQYGMDTISLGVTLAFAFECYEKGLLTRD